MTPDTSTALFACTQVTHQMFYFLDESRYEPLVALFSENGTLFRQGELLVGRDKIMQAMLKRSTTQRIRHVISNTLIESQSPGLANVVAYMMAYRFDDGAPHIGAVEINRPFRMSIVRATMRQTQNAWQITEMTFTPEFDFVSESR